MKKNLGQDSFQVFLVALGVGTLVSVITKIVFIQKGLAVISGFAGISLGALAVVLVVSFTGGRLSPFWFGSNCRKIGVVNSNGEAPLLLQIKSDTNTPHGIIITIWNRGLSLEDLEKNRENLESAFDIIVDKIRNPDGKRSITQIYAVPASCDLPTYLPWKKEYASRHTPGKVLLGQALTGLVYWNYRSQIHALIAGTTGSGKSQLVRLILRGLLRNKENNSVYILDFKRVDYCEPFYQQNAKVISEEAEFLELLKELVAEMHRRLEELSRYQQKNIDDFNVRIHSTWKHIFIVVDEASELFAKRENSEAKARIREIEQMMTSIYRMGRAAGLHIILSTQRPSVDSIPGAMKACIDAKICGRVTSDTESILVLDSADAVKRIPEPVPGRFLFNDMLFQAFYVDEEQEGDSNDEF